jgi:tetratricopeptide (TPR) repeat protein
MTKPLFFFDENLREVPADPIAFKTYIEELEMMLAHTTEMKSRVHLLGEIGVMYRTLGQLHRAEENIQHALQIVQDHHLGIKSEVQQKIRLAHVYQWQKRFSESDQLFSEVIALCRQDSMANDYLHFALQHAGKNLFDQGLYYEALKFFEEALKIRMQNKASQDQIDSTAEAILATQKRLKK